VKIGLHYSFQVEKESAKDVIHQGLDDIAAADRDGFSSVVFAEHHFLDDGWIPRPLLLAAAASSVTKKMKIGTDIVILALHHPVAVAEEVAVNDILCNGRFILGIGLGWLKEEFAGFGVPFKQRAAVYERSIGIVQQLLAGKKVSNEEGPYQFRDAQIRPLPVNPNGVPLWMGGLGDAALPRIARMGDAWVMPPGTKLDELVRQQKILLEARSAAGRPPFREFPLRREAFVAETDDKAWELFAHGLRHEYGKVYRPLHPTYPNDDSIENLRKWGEGVFVVGSPQTVANELASYKSALGATECLVRFQLPGVPAGAVRECLQGFREVIKLVKDL